MSCTQYWGTEGLGCGIFWGAQGSGAVWEEAVQDPGSTEGYRVLGTPKVHRVLGLQSPGHPIGQALPENPHVLVKEDISALQVFRT